MRPDGFHSRIYRDGEDRVRVYDSADVVELESCAAGAAALLAIRHPHLYPVHAIEATPALTVRGPILQELFAPAPIRDHVLGIVAQVAQALDALHRRSIAHLAIGFGRDAVGCVAEEGWGWRVVLGDSELARPFGAHVPVGAFAIASDRLSELRRGHFDARTDVFGLGELLSQLVAATGTRRPGIDPAVDDVIDRMRAVDPDRRPSTIDDVLAELEGLGWQRSPVIDPQPHDHTGHHQLVVVRPWLQAIALDRRRAATWTRRWSHASCDLWKYQDAWFVAPHRDRAVRIGAMPVQFPDRVRLRVGDVVATDEIAFVLAPLIAARAVTERASEEDRRAKPQSPFEHTMPATPAPLRTCAVCGTPSYELAKFCIGCGHELVAPTAAPPPAPAPIDRRQLGDWRIVEELGSGGMGQTFRVRRGDITGVAKRLLSEAAANPVLRERFEREIAMLRELRHVAIPQLLDYGIDQAHSGGLPYFVMEDGGPRSLDRALHDGRIQIDEAIATTRDILAALAHAHARGFVHRDVKPANIILARPSGFAKLLDFSVARASGHDRSSLTDSGVMIGTPVYMSPEQVRGAQITPASDVYGLGCVLYHMLSGEPPFSGSSLGELVQAHLVQPPPPLPATVPSALADMVVAMLAKNPEDRPSCREARDRLAPLLPTPIPTLDITARTEIAPGIWSVMPTIIGADTPRFAICLDDRRDGPRLRGDALATLARERPVGFVGVAGGMADAAWRYFDVEGPPPLPAGPFRLPAAMAAIAAVLAIIARSPERHYHLLERRHLRGSLSTPETFEIVLDVLDDDTRLAPAVDAASDCDEALYRLFAALLGGDRANPPADWPPPVRDLFAESQPRRFRTRFHETFEALRESLEPGWVAAIVRTSSRSPGPTLPGTLPPYALPEAPFALGETLRLPPETPPQDIGMLLGNWRIVRLLGTGGFGSVYQVEHVKIGKRAVAKVLAAHAASAPNIRSRFLDEARAVNQFHHPNIIDVFDTGDADDGRPYIVMEHLSGETVASRIARDGAFAIRDAVEIARQIAAGLAAAHAARIVHRDVKPANVVCLDEAGAQRVKIIDFGIARVPRTEFQTEPGMVMGTASYMPPEQWVDAASVDPRSDIYALGVMLFEMLAGEAPFSGTSIQELQYKSAREPAPRPYSPHGNVAPALAELVLEMLAKSRADRPASCEEVIRRLDAIAPPRAAAIETELERAGFTDVRAAGTTAEAIPRYVARDPKGPVTLYVAQPDLRGLRATARVGALQYLVETHAPLFVPVERAVVLPSRATVYVRRDPVPPALRAGETLEVGPTLAIAAVAFRALVLLRAEGRELENFSLDYVRADVSTPESFACMLQPPQVFERDTAVYATMAGNEYIGNVFYANPAQLMGMSDPHAIAYAIGILVHELLVGAPPFDGLAWFELNQRKISEDPPRLAARAGVPGAVAAFVDMLIARDERGRARPPAEIEAEILALLAAHPAWLAAAERVLASAPRLTAIAMPIAPAPSRPPTPTLAVGERVGAWTVASHLRFGGDAEVYRVTDDSAQRAILKLWYADGIDPYSDEWKKFRRGMLECAKQPGFPAVREVETIVRGRPRAFAVFEEIVGKDWRALVAGGRPATADVIELAARLVGTLADAHAQLGVVGDVSPTNVIVRDDPTRTPILLDVMTPGRARDQIAGYGTPGYVAPEVANGEAPSPRSDVFSAGVLVAELAVGARLFPDAIEGLQFPAGGFEAPIERALAEVRSGFGSAFAEVIAGMLAIDPEARNAARAVADELRSLTVRA